MISPGTSCDRRQGHVHPPQNAALIIIDFQPVQATSVAVMDRRISVANIVVAMEGR
jgi:hypothetical protein